MKNTIILFLCVVILPAAKSQNMDSIRTLMVNGKCDYAFYHQLIKVKDSAEIKDFQDLIEQIGTFFKPNMALNTKSENNIEKYYRPEKAIDYLDSMAKNQQVIIFNEAHDNPYHRVATTSFLSTLYKSGFRYFALESLKEKDDAINKRKYPLQDISGYYVNEPCYAEMVREALRLGFTLIPYEFKSQDNNLRERKQAENIVNRIFLKNPKAKVVIHCGYSHGSDKKIFEMMGYYLKEKSRINPFVVNQIVKINDSISEPTFFYSPLSNRTWHQENDGDAYLFLPKPKIVNNRPNWFTFGRKRYEYIPNMKEFNLEPPFLMQAFYKNEGNNAVPLDQIEIEDIKQNKGLWLYPGEYIFRVIDTKNVIKFEKNITIMD